MRLPHAIVAILLLLPLCASAQDLSPRAEIMNTLRLDFYPSRALAAQNPQGIKFVVNYLKIKNGWACVNVTPTRNEKEIADPRWAILQNIGGHWSDVNYARKIMRDDIDALDVLSFTGTTSARVANAFPTIPREILP